MSTEEDQETGSGIPTWAIYATVGVASYYAYKTLFKQSKFEHEQEFNEIKSEDYIPDYPKGDQYYSITPDQPLKIRLAKRGPASWKPIRIFELFKRAVRNHPNSIYWRKEYLKKGSNTEYEWKTWTRQEVFDLTHQCARAFIACGLQPWQSVSIIGFNAPEWVIADLGAIHAGGVVAGIYSSNKPGQCKYIASHSKSAVAVVENRKQLNKFLKIRDDLPDLKAIIVWDIDEHDPIIAESNSVSSGDNDSAKVMHWNEFMRLGNDNDTLDKLESEKEDRIKNIDPGQCCTLIYTSGTTGRPKAVMMSHDNITWQSRAVWDHFAFAKRDGSPHCVVSYLPLSHVAAQLLDIFLPMSFSADYKLCDSMECYFARPTALKGTLGDTLRVARPTLFFGVPRVFEKIQEKIANTNRENPPSALKAIMTKYLRSIVLQAFYNKSIGGSMDIPFGYSFAEKMLITKVRAKLGFDRCQAIYTGAAPTRHETLGFFASLGVNVMEVYGMSECSGVHTASLPYHNTIKTVGVPMTGVTTLLQHKKGRDAVKHGEICMRGRHVMMGYMYDELKTKQTIDDEGYLHSGDVGHIDEKHGVLTITGRIKELIITGGGENVAPVPIEDSIKAMCPAVSNVVLIGDEKKFLSVLLTLKVKANDDGTFTDNLDGVACDIDSDCKTVEDAKKSEKWKKYIENGIAQYNNDPDLCVSRAQTIKKYRILKGDFGVETGELTATMKLKRKIVYGKFDEAIQSMYIARVIS